MSGFGRVLPTVADRYAASGTPGKETQAGPRPSYSLPKLAPDGLEIGTFDESSGTGPNRAEWWMSREGVSVAWRIRFRDGRRLNDHARDEYAAARAIHMAFGLTVAQPIPTQPPAPQPKPGPAPDETLADLLTVIGAKSPGEAVFVLAQFRGQLDAADEELRRLRAENALLRAERT